MKAKKEKKEADSFANMIEEAKKLRKKHRSAFVVVETKLTEKAKKTQYGTQYLNTQDVSGNWFQNEDRSFSRVVFITE
jgi:hypothetical protein